jgi:outer membrane lipoprotein-sorting protein
MTRLVLLPVLVAACVFCGGANAALCINDTAPDVKAIIEKADELYRSTTSSAELEMTIVTPNWERTLSMDVWTEGMDKTFIIVNSPLKEKGIATLRIETEMWNYFPRINKVMKVPPSMMMGQWMSSDFTNDDIVKESTLLDDYTAKLFSPENAEPDYYYIELKPKEETVTVWGKIELVVEKETYLPARQVYYDEKGNAMRILDFKEVRELGGKSIPSVMEMTPLSKERKGHSTTIKYLEATFDEELPNDTFTLRNLQKKR